jgi:hypothetical protein
MLRVLWKSLFRTVHFKNREKMCRCKERYKLLANFDFNANYYSERPYITVPTNVLSVLCTPAHDVHGLGWSLLQYYMSCHLFKIFPHQTDIRLVSLGVHMSQMSTHLLQMALIIIVNNY